MQLHEIERQLRARGIEPVSRFTSAGLAVGFQFDSKQAVLSLVPIAESSIPGFIDYIVNLHKKTKEEILETVIEWSDQ